MLIRILKNLLRIVAVVALAVVILRLLFPLPDISNRAESKALPVSSDSQLAAFIQSQKSNHPNQSGVISLHGNTEALSARIALADLAETSIDLQYYIWHDDISGMLLFDALQRAARRGVRVRLLLDDNGIPGLDDYIAALNAEDNFEIRIFNPSSIRTPKMLGYAIDFFRINRRMHNKLMLIDGSAAIVGGRNIGDEYFQVRQNLFYLDLDVLAVGAILPKTIEIFDAYWNSGSVHAVETIIDGEGDAAALAGRMGQAIKHPGAKRFLAESERISSAFFSNEDAFEWTEVDVVADDPIKGEGKATRDDLMITRLGTVLGPIENRLDLVSAYFVPGQRGTDFFGLQASVGKTVNILTNALDTTDVLVVHAGYTKYRRELLEQGVNLYELKLRGTKSTDEFELKPFGLSGASLHAKTLSVDRNRIFIGSFNFDPRSVTLNCEMGFLIKSRDLAEKLSDAFDNRLENVSYRPLLTPEDSMVWSETIDGDAVVYQREPGANWLQQVMLVVIGMLPIEWLL